MCMSIIAPGSIMLAFEMVHDPQRAGDDDPDDQHAEGERQRVVGVVGTGRDVQEEGEMHAHLGDGERRERHRHARRVDEAGAARDPERGDGEPARARGRSDSCAGRTRSTCRRRSWIARGASRRAGVVCHALQVCSWARSQKIDVGEDADPDDVERVPEQREAQRPPQDVAAGTPSPRTAPSSCRARAGRS